jgi:peptidoglycan/xylan/chitin deacetylase (PgdA/CDA1 family)
MRVRYWSIALSALRVRAAVGARRRGGAPPCTGAVYLTLDTGNMRDAERIAQILRKHDVKATFFLANERTPRGDHALDPAWSDYWKARVGEGHAFGTHTWRHGRLLGDEADGAVRYRPQFGEEAGRTARLSAAHWCGELQRVGAAFKSMTGQALDPLWRAPGGHVTRNALAGAQSCGFAHVAWAPAGFLGDELPSETYPNDRLLAQRVARRARRRHSDGAPGHLVACRPVRADARSADRRPAQARPVPANPARTSAICRAAQRRAAALTHTAGCQACAMIPR